MDYEFMCQQHNVSHTHTHSVAWWQCPCPCFVQGRATLEMKVTLKESAEGAQDTIMTIVLDGYNAPVSAGNFMDLVLRKFYDGMEIQRADGFVVQTGDPEGPEDGFKDPATGEIRR